MRRAGCLTVPRYREAAGVVDAFERFAAAIGATIPTQADNGESADRTAFDTLLTRCDLLAVACHGYVSPADSTIAWLVAADGSLPLLGSVESERETGARHRYTWRDADRLRSTSPVVISAACRSGTTHYGGVTEELGFYAALRRHGTRTFIAPRWDVPAVETLPVFAEVAAGLAAGTPPAAAARAASLAARTTQPPWIAFAPSVTGGWW
jgi:CHAT domain-containing protein